MEEFASRIYNPDNIFTQDFALFTDLARWNAYSDYTIWLRILRDHMMMINQKLGKKEVELQDTTLRLQNEGERLRQIAFDRAQRNMSLEELPALNSDALNLIQQVRTVKQLVLNRQLTGQIKIGFTPTIISHMLNELNNFLFIATTFATTGKMPPVILMNHHDLWVSDMVGHLDVIKCDLDGVEKMLHHRVEHNKKVFEEIHSKILEFISYIKHGVVEFPALQRLTLTSIDETMIYLQLVREIYDQVNNKMIVSRLDPEFLLHMILEEMYYLRKLRDTQYGFDPVMKFPILNPNTVQLVSNMRM